MNLDFPKNTLYKNQPLTFRNASGDGDKFQILKSRIKRALESTTDEEQIKKLNEALDHLNILEEDEIEIKKASDELREKRKEEIDADGSPDKDKDILKHRRVEAENEWKPITDRITKANTILYNAVESTDNEKELKELSKIQNKLDEFKKIIHLDLEERDKKLDPDNPLKILDVIEEMLGEEEPKKRRIDDPEDPIMQNERRSRGYSVLSYSVASVQDSTDDNFMEQIVKGKKGERGDSFMKKLGLR